MLRRKCGTSYFGHRISQKLVPGRVIEPYERFYNNLQIIPVCIILHTEDKGMREIISVMTQEICLFPVYFSIISCHSSIIIIITFPLCLQLSLFIVISLIHSQDDPLGGRIFVLSVFRVPEFVYVSPINLSTCFIVIVLCHTQPVVTHFPVSYWLVGFKSSFSAVSHSPLSSFQFLVFIVLSLSAVCHFSSLLITPDSRCLPYLFVGIELLFMLLVSER